MKKSFFLAMLLAFCFCLTSFSQFTVGPRIGLNLSYYGFNYNDTLSVPNTKLKPGPQVGIMFANKFNDQIGLRASIVYSYKGTSINTDKTEIQWDGTIIKKSRVERFTLNYIEIPVEGTFGIMAGEVYIFSNVGAYFAYTFGGMARWEEEYSFEYTNGTIDSGTDDGDHRIKVKNEAEIWDDNHYYIRPIDYGLNFGIGFKIKYIMFNAQYGLGLCNITTKSSINDNYQKNHQRCNRGISFYFAFLFGDKEKESPQ